MKQFTITIQDKEGLHARPAGLLSKAAKGFESTATLTKGEKTADLKKIFAVMGLAVKGGLIGCHRLRAEKDIRSPGLDIEVAGGIIGQVDRLGLRPSGGTVVLIPAQQDPLLIGAGPDDHFAPGEVGGSVYRGDVAGGFHREGQGVHPVSRKIELLFALLGYRDIDQRHIVAAGGDAQRPVLPRGRHHIQLQPQAARHQSGDIRLAAEQGFVVIGEDRQRW